MDTHPEVEREIAFDIVRHGLLVAPVVILVCGLIAGWEGAVSAAIAIGIVCLNFVIAAVSVSWAAKISPAAVGGVAMGGYVVRLAIILVALILLRRQGFIILPILGFTLVGAHLGLLFWEMRYVSMSLGAPGLRPRGPVPTGDE